MQLVDSLGPYVCMVKTHIDTVTDFTVETAVKLKRLAVEHDFVIMEDRYCDVMMI